MKGRLQSQAAPSGLEVIDVRSTSFDKGRRGFATYKIQMHWKLG